MMTTLEETEKNLLKAAKRGMEILNDKMATPQDRAIELSKVMVGLSQVKASLELLKAQSIREEKRIFSSVLSRASAKSMEERFAHTKAASEVLDSVKVIDYIDARYSECRSLMAAFKHGLLTFRGMMGMKE